MKKKRQKRKKIKSRKKTKRVKSRKKTKRVKSRKKTKKSEKKELIFKVPKKWSKNAYVDKSQYEKKYKLSIKDNEGFWKKAIKIDEEAVGGPGFGTVILNYKFKSSSVKERAIYIYEQLQLPENERVLKIKELDEGQVMHKPGKL